MIEPVIWRDNQLFIIDQTLLPGECREIPLDTAEGVWEAIRSLRVRGAPAIGVCAAHGAVVALREKAPDSAERAQRVLSNAVEYLATARPTAVNLFWALGRMKRVAEANPSLGPAELEGALLAEARAIYEEEKACCKAIGDNGAELLHDGDGVITHCNTGPLATGAYGTALAVALRAHERGVQVRVYADETRPLLQGARLTTWECMQAGVPVTLLCDNAAAHLMGQGKVHIAITGADRIAANGDTANKIGTYSLALAAAAHNVPFYVAAPFSTFDLAVPTGDGIPIEERDASEVTHGFGAPTAPDGVDVYNPAFDITPARLIAGIITERGILRPPYGEAIQALYPGAAASAAGAGS